MPSGPRRSTATQQSPAPLDQIVSSVDDHSGQSIAAAISRLVSNEQLAPGTRLPTVRELAAALGTSPATVSSAWNALAGLGIIESRGRLGSFVLGHPSGTQRYSRISGDLPARFRLDLASGTPDAELLPDLAPALRRIGRRAHVGNYHDEHILPALEQRLRSDWPYPPESVAVLDGALDALDRLASLLIRLGDRVLVENPTFPAFLDMVDMRGAQVVPVQTDAHGPVPQSLAAGLTLGPVAFFLQPRAQNPTGAGLTRSRTKELAGLLRGTDVVVLEDDHSGDISATADLSIGQHLPEQTVHVRSYSKTHGPDLRLAAVGGPASIIGPVLRRRQLGSGWSSRLLQGLLLDLLDDKSAQAGIVHAREVYADRRQQLRGALASRGVVSTPGSGVNLWVEVSNERTALITLAAAGIRVSPGGPYVVSPVDGDHIRVTSGVLSDGVESVAEHIARAARLGRELSTVRPRSGAARRGPTR
jgi:DNA-binding transcriptional MocR family regulator